MDGDKASDAGTRALLAELERAVSRLLTCLTRRRLMRALMRWRQRVAL